MLYEKLHDFQLAAYQKLKDLPNGILLALDMGLGKTITAASILEHWINDKKITNAFVVCQPIKTDDWIDQLKEMVIPENWKIILVRKTSDLEQIPIWNQQHNCLFVIPFVAFSNLQFLNFYNDIVNQQTGFIFDECQNMKDWKTKISQAGLKMADHTKWKIMLSGDPISNSYKDLFVLTKILGFNFDGWDNLEMEKIFFDYYFLEWKTFDISPTKTITKPTGNKHEEELINLLHQKGTFIKTEEVIDLPQQFFQNIYLDLPIEFHKILNEMRQNYDQINWSGFDKKNIKPVLYNEMFIPKIATDLFKHNFTMASGFLKKDDHIEIFHHNKLFTLAKIFQMHPDENIVIFYNFNQELEMIKEHFANKKNIVEINGQNHLDTALPKITPTNTLILVQYRSGATGINLQTYSHIVIYYSLPTSGELYKQSLKRIHRIGQEKDCYYYHLITNNSVEEKIYETIKNSQTLTDAMFLNWLKTRKEIKCN